MCLSFMRAIRTHRVQGLRTNQSASSDSVFRTREKAAS